MEKIDALIAQIRANGDEVWMAGPQSEKAVAELERVMKVRLPPSYRAFLLRFGALSILDSCVSGIIDGEVEGDGAGWLKNDTERFREEFEVPDHLLVVQPDEDSPYCLDTRTKSASGEYPLVSYELDSQDSEVLADSFGTWFLDWLRLQAEE